MQAQARSYTLDRTAATNGSKSGYQRITTTGAYQGDLTKAKAVKANTDARRTARKVLADVPVGESAADDDIPLWEHSKESCRFVDSAESTAGCSKRVSRSRYNQDFKSMNFKAFSQSNLCAPSSDRNDPITQQVGAAQHMEHREQEIGSQVIVHRVAIELFEHPHLLRCAKAIPVRVSTD